MRTRRTAHVFRVRTLGAIYYCCVASVVYTGCIYTYIYVCVVLTFVSRKPPKRYVSFMYFWQKKKITELTTAVYITTRPCKREWSEHGEDGVYAPRTIIAPGRPAEGTGRRR